MRSEVGPGLMHAQHDWPTVHGGRGSDLVMRLDLRRVEVDLEHGCQTVLLALDGGGESLAASSDMFDVQSPDVSLREYAKYSAA